MLGSEPLGIERLPEPGSVDVLGRMADGPPVVPDAQHRGAGRQAPAWPIHAGPCMGLPRKEVIQPQLPLRLPCYDFTPVTSPTFDGSLP